MIQKVRSGGGRWGNSMCAVRRQDFALIGCCDSSLPFPNCINHGTLNRLRCIAEKIVTFFLKIQKIVSFAGW